MTDETSGRTDSSSDSDIADRAPRTGGDVTQAPPVQIGMLLLLLLLALLALWIVWSLLTAT